MANYCLYEHLNFGDGVYSKRSWRFRPPTPEAQKSCACVCVVAGGKRSAIFSQGAQFSKKSCKWSTAASSMKYQNLYFGLAHL
jgi:hypothetical protein